MGKLAKKLQWQLVTSRRITNLFTAMSRAARAGLAVSRAYHQQFLTFGSNEVTLWTSSKKKITEFQEVMMQQRLAIAGIDQSKTLAEV